MTEPQAVRLSHGDKTILEPLATVPMALGTATRRPVPNGGSVDVMRKKMQPHPQPLSDFVDRVIHGDCVRVMAAMPSASVDFVLTDPPYAARYRYRTGRTVANDDTTSWLTPAFAQVARVLRNNRFCVSFYGWHKVDAFMDAWRAAGLRPRAHFVWPKRYASGRNLVAYCHEQAFLLAKGEPPKPDLVLRDVLEWRYTGNIHHPTQKPLVALRPLIAAYSSPGDIVLDPFSGSGATALAAKEAGRRYIAIELDSSYCDGARERLLRS
jgi:adenine-specific DNA-methyltransferase